ncbi:MAG: glycosyltransferase [Opitutae bacterium]|nr:glycosyltransferase [Opitutae bacterium]
MSEPPSPEAVREPFSAQGKRLGVFVISYNAELLIQETLRRIPEEIWREVEVVYVVDDCSMDETTRKAMDYPDPHGKLAVFRNRVNRRYGGNQKFGYQYAIDRGLDAVVMLHGDGQYAPEMLPDLFRPLVDGDADVVIGSRMINRRDALKGGMPKYKFVANIFLTWIENLLSGLSMSEFHSGYRGYGTRFLRRVPLWDNSDEWHFDTHILLQARQAGAAIRELPIPTRYGDEVCHVNGISYGLNCICSALLFRLHRWGLIRLNRYDIAPRTLVESHKLDDPYSSHSLILRRLRQMKLQGHTALDLGFGCAAIASALAKEGVLLDGIDRDPRAIAESGSLFRRTFPHDLDHLAAIPLEGKYDILLAADTLQFLVDPADALSRLKKYLVKGGLLAVSLPNVVNIQTRLRILFGRFPLHHRGLLEEQALHFYTLDGMRQLLVRAGWQVEETDVTSFPLTLVFPFLRRRRWRIPLWICRGVTLLFKGLFAYQGVLFCKNPNEADLL